MFQDNMDMPCYFDFCGSDSDIDTMRDEGLEWECKDGTVIAISEMTTSHIKNCINLIKKSVNNDKPWRLYYLEPLLEELKNRQLFDELRNMSDEDFNRVIHKRKK